jgi:hypothetical protein
VAAAVSWHPPTLIRARRGAAGGERSRRGAAGRERSRRADPTAAALHLSRSPRLAPEEGAEGEGVAPPVLLLAAAAVGDSHKDPSNNQGKPTYFRKKTKRKRT